MTKLLALLLLIGSINAQRILYGLPPLPHDDSDDDLLAPPPPTPPPFKFHTFAPFTFATIPPLNQFRPFDINPIPELPPIPESRIDGTFDSDGNFVPRVKPEPQQVAENRIHGVKVEPHVIPNLFHPTPPTFTSRKAYSKARGISVVTVTPNIVKRPQQHVISSQNTDPEPQFDEPVVPIQSGGTKNARQWQTTAVKLSNNQERIKLADSIESIDKVLDTPQGRLEFDDAPVNDFDRAVSASAEIAERKVHHGSSNSTETPARKEIVTTRLAVEPFGSEIHVPTPTVAPVTTPPPGKVFHRPTKNGRVINHDRRGSGTSVSSGASHGLFEYRPKQRTFQPEQVFVTRAPVARPRQIPNPTNPPPPIFANIGPTTLPPQPLNRAPEDAAFLAEVEEYDWRLHYRQAALEAASRTPGFRSRPLLQNRAHADPQRSGANPGLDADYDDLEAIRIREHFTENPPQKNFQLGAPETAANVDSDNKEVLVPFSSGSRSPISTSNVEQVGSQPEPAFNRPPSAQVPVTPPPGLGGLGFNPQNNGYLGGITPHPLFNGLFNLFNINGAQNGGGLNLFPGLGR